MSNVQIFISYEVNLIINFILLIFINSFFSLDRFNELRIVAFNISTFGNTFNTKQQSFLDNCFRKANPFFLQLRLNGLALYNRCNYSKWSLSTGGTLSTEIYPSDGRRWRPSHGVGIVVCIVRQTLPPNFLEVWLSTF